MIYIVSNREVDPENNPEVLFGTRPEAKGIDNLRVGKAQKVGRKWKVTIEEDHPTDSSASNIVSVDTPIEMRPSFRLFQELQNTMKTRNRNCVFYVHGYNTNFRNALESAKHIQDLYGVEVILFSWPSMGAGEGRENIGKDLIGTVNYKRDKRIAAQSRVALDRTFEHLHRYIQHSLVDVEQQVIRETGGGEFSPSRMDGILARGCNQRFTLFCHSMGNYLFKDLLKSSIYQGETLLFDNVILCAADVNNDGHETFVDRIQHRRQIYITINQNDFALFFSRMKFGSKQKARLGHYARNLTSQTAIYLDFTEAEHVKRSHSYFSDDAAKKNESIFEAFNSMFNGERAERRFVDFDPNANVYHFE